MLFYEWSSFRNIYEFPGLIFFGTGKFFALTECRFERVERSKQLVGTIKLKQERQEEQEKVDTMCLADTLSTPKYFLNKWMYQWTNESTNTGALPLTSTYIKSRENWCTWF